MITPVLYCQISFVGILNIFSSVCQHVDCVILDDGGFLLMSNQDEYISLVSCLWPFAIPNPKTSADRPHDSAKLWVRLLQDSLSQEGGFVFGLFSPHWSCSAVPRVCEKYGSAAFAHCRLLLCEWLEELASETLHVSLHRSTAGFHPPS